MSVVFFFCLCFLGGCADALLHEDSVAAGAQRLSAEGPLGVGKDTVCVPELKGAAQSRIYLRVLNTLEASV